MKNRTYRYMENEALYPFGYGLTYQPFAASNLKVEQDGENVRVTLSVTNEGSEAASQKVQVYVKDLESSLAVPNHSLAAFRAVHLNAGETQEVVLTVKRRSFEAVNEEGEWVLDSHRFRIYAGFSQPDARSVALMGQAPLETEWTL